MKKLTFFLMMTLIVSCVPDVLTRSSNAETECVWVKKILINAGDILTRQTAEEIVSHNRKVEEFCR